MGRQKRKNNSPLLKERDKNPRTGEQDSDVGEDASNVGPGDDADVISGLKDFIRMENERNSKSLTEEIRRHTNERMTALENSLSFALTANETLAKRLSAVEHRARQAEQDLFNCASRLAAVEEQLDLAQQRECSDWLVFSGPAVSRMPKSGRDQDAAQLVHDMVWKLMNYDLDMRQLGAVHRDAKQIRVRFNVVTAGSDRFYLVRNKTRLRGTGLYIRERLTPFRQRIFNDMLQLKRNKKIHTVFTKEGTVFVVIDRMDRPRPVRTEAAVERLVQVLSERTANHQDGAQSQQRGPEGTHAPSVISRGSHPPGAEGVEVPAVTDGSLGAAAQLGSSPPSGAPSSGPVAEGRVEWGRRRPADHVEAAGADRSLPGPESDLPGRGLSASSAGRAYSGSVDRGEQRTAPGESGSLDIGGSDGDPGRGDGSSRVTVNEESPVVREQGRSGGTSSTHTTGGTRRRFGGDIRRFVSGYSSHTKCD